MIDQFSSFWLSNLMTVKSFDVGDSLLPRKRKRPLRYEEGSANSFYPESPEDHFKLIYFEAINQQRFDQPGYKIYQQLENVLFNAASMIE